MYVNVRFNGRQNGVGLRPQKIPPNLKTGLEGDNSVRA